MRELDNKQVFDFLSADQIKRDEPMSSHTTFRAGGNADYIVMPRTKEELSRIIITCRERKLPFYIIGNGSNLLVSDKGYRGVIIQLYKNMSGIRICENMLYAQAGVLLSSTAAAALESSLSGMEFAAGIPGTIGGAVSMNAGAYGSEMKNIVHQVVLLDENGGLHTVSGHNMEFAYRTSIVTNQNMVVVEVILELKKERQEVIRERMEELRVKRVSKQPLEFPSAGSTFKRPEGYYAGKLIMDAGLSGCAIGGAEVSIKHCGFIINKKHASASEIYQLICHVQRIVKEKSGVELELEVKLLGDFA